VLALVEDDVPQPGPGEVRLRVLAAGVAWGDILKREGFGWKVRFPFTPGYDVVGVVDAVGPGVSADREGGTVAALVLSGGYAEFICAPESSLVPVPPGLDPAEVVCLVMNYVVAHQLLHRTARVAAGETVLVHNAAGGIGTALLQLGRLAGLTLYGTASAHKHHVLDDLGAVAIDHRQWDVRRPTLAPTRQGVDVVFDPRGGLHLAQSYRLLRRGGRLVCYGLHAVMSEGRIALAVGLMVPSVLSLVPDGRRVLAYGVTRPPYSSPQWCREDLTTLMDLLACGDAKPLIAARVQLSEARSAHELLETGAVAGKVVLIPGSIEEA